MIEFKLNGKKVRYDREWLTYEVIILYLGLSDYSVVCYRDEIFQGSFGPGGAVKLEQGMSVYVI